MSVADKLVTIFEAEDRTKRGTSSAKKNVKEAADASQVSAKTVKNTFMSMGNVIDDVMGRIFLDGEKYAKVMDFMTKATAGLIRALPGVAAGLAAVAIATASYVSGFAVGMAPIAANLAGLGVSGWFLNQTRPIWEAAMAVESYETSFAGMLGSVAKGKQMMDWVRDYGMKSAFEQDPIRHSARTLIAGGLDVEQYMPVMEKIALFRGPQAENLQHVGDIMRRLIGGQITDALGPEGFGRMGINRQMMVQVGAEFDNQGRFKGSIQDALAMLERLTQTNPMMKDLKAQFESTNIVKLSNAMDILNRSLEISGKNILIGFMPAIEAVGKTLMWLNESGTLDIVTSKIVRLLGGDDADDGVASAILFVVGAVESLIDTLQWMKDVVGTIFSFVGEKVSWILGMIQKIPSLNGGFNMANPFDPMNLVRLFINGKNTAEGIQAPGKSMYEKYQEDSKKKRKSPEAPDQNLMEDVMSPAVTELKEIKKANQETNKILKDYMQNVLGGGNIAAMGVTPTELSARSGNRGSRIVRVASILNDLVQETAMDLVRSQAKNSRIRSR